MACGLRPQIPRLLGVIGAGQMGAGIAQAAAAKGIPVVLADVTQTALDTGLAIIRNSLVKQVHRQQKAQHEADDTINHIRTVLSLQVTYTWSVTVAVVSTSSSLRRRCAGAQSS